MKRNEYGIQWIYMKTEGMGGCLFGVQKTRPYLVYKHLLIENQIT